MGFFCSLKLLILINYLAFMSEYVGRRRGTATDECCVFNKQASKEPAS